MERITYQDLPKGMFEKLQAVEAFINNAGLDQQLLELVRLRAAQLNGCAYCVDMHYKELRHLGETELRLSSLSVWEETPYFSEKERAVLQFTEALTRLNEKPIDDTVFNPLLNFFNKTEISYISLAIAQTNVWNRLMKAFQFTPGRYRVPKSRIAVQTG